MAKKAPTDIQIEEYNEAQRKWAKESGITINDYVLVTRRPKPYEGGWREYKSDDFVKGLVKIETIWYDGDGLSVKSEKEDVFKLPYTCIEVIKPEQKFKADEDYDFILLEQGLFLAGNERAPAKFDVKTFLRIANDKKVSGMKKKSYFIKSWDLEIYDDGTVFIGCHEFSLANFLEAIEKHKAMFPALYEKKVRGANAKAETSIVPEGHTEAEYKDEPMQLLSDLMDEQDEQPEVKDGDNSENSM